MDAFFLQLHNNPLTAQAAQIYCDIMRYAFAILAIVIVYRCARSLLQFKAEPEVWAWLSTPSGERISVMHWESLLGRGKNCDVVLNYPTISRSHAVLTRYDDASWSISDVGSKGGIRVNGKEVSMAVVKFGDRIDLGGVEFTLVPITKEQERIQASVRTRAAGELSPALTLLLVTVFQILASVQLVLNCKQGAAIVTSFAVLICLQWALFLLYKILRRTGFDLECVAFFLCTMGLCVIATSNPNDMFKQVIAMIMGIAIFLTIGLILRNHERVINIRYILAAAGILLLVINLVFGVEKFGAKNWMQIGSFSFQPSELVKICFIFAGVSTLQRLMTKRNLILFIVYSAVVCGCLALMSDFGTAIIFFCTFLVIAFLRSGDFATLGLACAGTGFAGVLAVRFRPYIKNRMSGWRHIWENPLTTGYQQTKALMCLASGGLFGLGAGNGWLKYLAASDTDLVFAYVSEEWGLIIALLMIVCIVLLAIFVMRSIPHCRSSFYSVSAAAAATIYVVQTILNVFGTVDFLPLTGVTFPFVSNGGSSMLCVWGLLAFIKGADTRQNASFVIRLPSKKGGRR